MEQTPQPTKPKSPGSDIENREQITVSWAEKTIPKELSPELPPRINEDSILVDENHRAFGVFDGMGGHAKGDIASQMARNYVLTHLSAIPNGISVDEARKKLSEIIAGANKAVYVESMSDSEKRGMGTTGVVLKIHTNSKGEDFAIIANVGDSRLYEINEDGTVTQLTVDDDLISEDPNLSNEEKARISKKLSEFRKKEELSKLEGLFFNQRNIVVRCIGYESDLASILAFPVKRGSRFILTSDGVPGNITTQEIEEAIQQSGTLEEIAEELIKRSLDRSREPRSEEPRAHPDDMSVVVVACK